MQIKTILLAAAAVSLGASAWSAAQSMLTSSEPALAVPVLNGPPRFKVVTTVRETLFTRKVAPTQAQDLENQALRSLAREPLDPTALWVWGAASPAPRAPDTILIAERVSRRELGVQMELFRALATNKDLAGGFRHLDRALTVYPEASATLLPGIAQSLDLSEIRALLIPYSQRPWFAGLVRQAAQNAPDTLGVAALLTEANTSVNALTPGTLPMLLAKLLSAEECYEAGQLAIRMQAISAEGLEQFGVSDQTINPESRPLTWQLTNSDAASVKQNGKSTIVFTVEPGRSATLLDRVTVYRSGTYLLSNTLSGSDPRLSANWELRCIGSDGERLAQSQRIPVNATPQSTNVEITVPQGCPAQRWVFKASASDLQVSATGELKQINLQLAEKD